jgi:hypothetical protein
VTQPLRTIGRFGDEATQPLRVPAQSRSRAGSRTPARQPAAALAADTGESRPVLRPAVAQPQLVSR